MLGESSGGVLCSEGAALPCGFPLQGYREPVLTLSPAFPALFASCVRAAAARPAVSHYGIPQL